LKQQIAPSQKQSKLSSETMLLIDFCQTSYGFAAIACTQIGIQTIDLFTSKPELDQHIQKHAIGNPANSDLITSEHRALIERAKLAVSKHLPLNDCPLDLSGTTLQLRVWHQLRSIPPGKVCSYSEVASALGIPNAVRAVANACARNVVALAIPCHRVIRADGCLGDYRWGAILKQKLFLLEAQSCSEIACF
jgi:AraC family transcriptional regulator of adaptative response/methylated-DNA-[protein]-cysteine methyltransferase